jgi:NADPH2:quinone reductase
MKEAIVHPLPTISVEIQDVPIPSPGPDQAVIKVEVAGSNVKGTISSRKEWSQKD